MKGLMGIYFKNEGLAPWIIAGCAILFLIISQTGCAHIIANKKAAEKTHKVGERKGRFLRENVTVLEESPKPLLLVRLEHIGDKSVHVVVRAQKRQLVKVERVYERIVTRKIYRPTDPVSASNNPFAWALDIFCSPLSWIIGLNDQPILKKIEEKSEGESKEANEFNRDKVVSNLPILLDCGPAGRHKLVTDKNGKAVLNLEPLINRLTKNYDWTIVASTSYEGLTVTNSLTLNTTDLGVTWAKPRFQPDLPPRIIATARFKDQNNNQMLNAKEKAALLITLKNVGRGDAFHIDVKPEFTGKVEGVEISPSNQLRIETLAKGKEKTVEFSLSAAEEVPAQRFRVRMSFAELNGFEPAPLMINLATRSYSPPRLALARWSLDDDNEGLSTGNGNRRLERGEQAELTLFIQNLGAGAAENVQVEFKANDSDLYTKALAADLGEIPPGEWRKAVFILRVNNRYNGPEKLPVDVAINERRPKFALAQPLEIMLGQDVSREKEVMLAGDMRPAPTPTLSPLPKIERKKSIEITDLVRGTEYAVLIAINNYIDSEVRPPVIRRSRYQCPLLRPDRFSDQRIRQKQCFPDDPWQRTAAGPPDPD